MEALSKLIEDCKDNKRTSQEKLYRMFYPALFLLCKRLFTDDRDALEALNDGMLKVFTSLSSYNEKKGQFFNWVYTVVRNAALDKLKSKQMFSTTELTENIVVAASDNPLQRLEWKDIYLLLNVLTPATRAVCSLFYLEGYSVEDISRNLQISRGTVKWHLSEIRKKIKPVLKNYHL